jgi:hypothetical protein
VTHEDQVESDRALVAVIVPLVEFDLAFNQVRQGVFVMPRQQRHRRGR